MVRLASITVGDTRMFYRGAWINIRGKAYEVRGISHQHNKLLITPVPWYAIVRAKIKQLFSKIVKRISRNDRA